MGAGCCGGNSGTGYTGTAYAPMESRLDYAGPSKYRQAVDRRLDLGHHALNPLAHMNDLYRKPQHHGPYIRPEDANIGAQLAQAVERLASPEQKYGSRIASIVYRNVSGV